MKYLIGLIVSAVLVCLMPASAWADDWVAVKLRGNVVQFVDDAWSPVKRGDVVPDDRLIQTTQSGRVQFQRDMETIDLGPQTQIRISDKSGKRFTTVKQYSGVVTIEADVRNVQHFAVQTPHLAAVVKGTIFRVSVGKSGSQVSVSRGAVAVIDTETRQNVVIKAGQKATVEDGERMDVSGRGNLPTPVNADGTPINVANSSANSRGVSVEARTGSRGVSVEARAGDLNVGVNVGSGGIGVNVGGIGVNVGGGSSGGSGGGGGSSGGSSSGGGGSSSGGGSSGGGGAVSSAVSAVTGVVGGLL